MEFLTDDGSLTEDHHLRKWNKLMLEGLAIIKRDQQPGFKLREWVENAGFVNIREEKFRIPQGNWPKDPVLKETGMMNLVQFLEGVEGMSLKVFGMLGWSRVEIEVLLAQVRSEIRSNTYHAWLGL